MWDDSVGAKVLITGASGYVGARLYYDLSHNFDVVGTYNSKSLSPDFKKLDITDSKAVMDLVNAQRPDVIVHAAAEASSKSCEADPEKAVSINQVGTENVVNASDAIGARLVYISATVAELQNSLYEKTKFSGEQATKKAKAGYVILRPSVVFGMSPNMTTDKPFNQILKNTGGGGKLTYDTSWKFQPAWLAHLSEVIAEVIRRDIINVEANVVIDEMKSKFDIANDVLSKFGIGAEPVDEKSWRPSIPVSLDGLRHLNLPMHSYSEMVEGIVKEILEGDAYAIR